MRVSLSVRSVVAVVKDQVSCDLGGEAAILSLNNGVYYGLDAVGARIWTLLHKPISVSEIRDTLLNEYEVEPGRCESDLLALLKNLAAQALIEIKDESTS
ncbi:MAG: PqqD family peptide modification chaperone [Bacteroidota bacterium]